MNAYAPAIVGAICILFAGLSALWIARRPPAKIRAQRRLLRELDRKGRKGWTKRLYCRLRGHAWVEANYKRHCAWCGKHETLFENLYPRIGEAKYEWR